MKFIPMLLAIILGFAVVGCSGSQREDEADRAEVYEFTMATASSSKISATTGLFALKMELLASGGFAVKEGSLLCLMMLDESGALSFHQDIPNQFESWVKENKVVEVKVWLNGETLKFNPFGIDGSSTVTATRLAGLFRSSYGEGGSVWEAMSFSVQDGIRE